MHLCLTIPEILRLIVEEACVTSQWQLFMLDENSVDTRTAYALARTCRNFLEPALDILWTCQRDLNFLISCMPDKLLEGRMTVAGAVHMVIRFYFAFRLSAQTLTYYSLAPHPSHIS